MCGRSSSGWMRQAGANVEFSNHPNDYGLERAEQLRDHPNEANPFVLGQPRTQRFTAVMDAMLRGRIAATEPQNEPRPRAEKAHTCC